MQVEETSTNRATTTTMEMLLTLCTLGRARREVSVGVLIVEQVAGPADRTTAARVAGDTPGAVATLPLRLVDHQLADQSLADHHFVLPVGSSARSYD